MEIQLLVAELMASLFMMTIRLGHNNCQQFYNIKGFNTHAFGTEERNRYYRRNKADKQNISRNPGYNQEGRRIYMELSLKY